MKFTLVQLTLSLHLPGQKITTEDYEIMMLKFDALLKQLQNNQLTTLNLQQGKSLDWVKVQEEKTLTGHTDTIWCLIQLADGRLATGSDDKTIKIWNLQTNYCITLSGHTNTVRCLIQLSNGWLASGSDDYSIKLWDINTGRCLDTLQGHKNYVVALAQLADGRLVSGSNRETTIRCWNLETKQQVSSFEANGGVNCLLQLYDGRLVSGGNCYYLQLWDIETKQCTTSLYTDQDVYSLIQLMDGRLVSGANPQIALWDVTTNQCIKTICIKTMDDHNNRVYGLAQISNNHLVSGTPSDALRIWDINSGQCLKNFSAGSIYGLAFLADGRIARESTVTSYAVGLWEAPTLLNIKEITILLETLAHNTSVQTLDCSTWGFDEALLQTLIQTIKQNKNLTALHLNHCGLTDLTAKSLFETIEQDDNHIQFVTLEGNAISASQVTALQQKLAKKMVQFYPNPRPLGLGATTLAEQHFRNETTSEKMQQITLPSKVFTPEFIAFYQELKQEDTALPLLTNVNQTLSTYRQTKLTDKPQDALLFHVNVMKSTLRCASKQEAINAPILQAMTGYFETTLTSHQAGFGQLLTAVPGLNNELTHTVTAMQQPLTEAIATVSNFSKALQSGQSNVGLLALTEIFNPLQQTIRQVRQGVVALSKLDKNVIIQTTKALFTNLAALNTEAFAKHRELNQQAMAVYSSSEQGDGTSQLMQKHSQFGLSAHKAAQLQERLRAAVDGIGLGFTMISQIAQLRGNHQFAKEVMAVGRVAVSVANIAVSTLSAIGTGFAVGGPIGAMVGGLASLISGIFSLFNSGPPPEEVTQGMIVKLSEQVEQVRQEMHARFDHLEGMLVTASQQMHGRFDRLETILGARFDRIEQMLGAMHRQIHGRFDRLETILSQMHHGIMDKFIDVSKQISNLHETAKIIQALSQGMQGQLRQLESKVDRNGILILSHNFNDSQDKLFNQPKSLTENDFRILCTRAAVDAQKALFAGEPDDFVVTNAIALGNLLEQLRGKPIEYHINCFFNYAKQNLGLAISLSSLRVVNPQIWADAALCLVEFYYKMPSFNFEEKVNSDNLNRVINAGKDVCQFILQLKVSDTAFRQLLNQYREAAKALIKFIDTHPKSQSLRMLFMRQVALLQWKEVTATIGNQLSSSNFITNNLPSAMHNITQAAQAMCLQPMSNTSDIERRQAMAKNINASVRHLVYEKLESTNTLIWSEAELKTIAELQTELSNDAQKDSLFRNLLQQLDFHYHLLTGFIALAFRKPYQEDSRLHCLLTQSLWDSQSFMGYLQQSGCLQRQFVHLAMENDALTAIDALEIVLMNYINAAQQSQKLNTLKTDYPLLEELMVELHVFTEVVLPLPTEAVNFQDNYPIVPASDEFKKAVIALVKEADFTFELIRQKPNELVIKFTADNSVVATAEEIRKHLTDLIRKFQNDIMNLGLKEKCKMTLNWTASELKISSKDSVSLNCIGALLKDAGQNFWEPSQLANSQVFFFKPQKSQRASTNSAPADSKPTEEISCAMQ
jgi:WD40 repeat protein